jgi:ribosomal protein L20
VAVDRYSGKTHRIHLLRITRGYVSGQGPSLRQDGKPLAKARWNEYVHFTAEDEQKFRELHAKRIAPFK